MWQDIPLSPEEIERIEVIRGPDAAGYGANSFLGIVSIITRAAAENHGVRAKISSGTQAIRDGQLGFGDSTGNLDYRVTLGFQQDSGFAQRYDDNKGRSITTTADYRLGSRDVIETRLGYKGGENLKGDSGDLTDDAREQRTISRYEHLRWRRDLGGGDNLSIQAYRNFQESDEQFNSLTDPPLITIQFPINYDYADERVDAELQHTMRLSDRIRTVWGFGWREDTVLSPGFLGTAETISNRSHRAFLNIEWQPVDRLLVNTGAMWENDEIVGQDVSPRIALNYHVNDSHTVRASLSRATRNPVIVEEMGDYRLCLIPGCAFYEQVILASGGLSPEIIRERELGYYAALSRTTSADFRIYRQELIKLISSYQRPSTDPFVLTTTLQDFSNRDGAVIHGLEAQFTYRPGTRDRMVLGYAYTKIRDTGQGDASESAPRVSGSLMLIRSLTDTLQASATCYYVGSMSFTDNHMLKPIRRVDLRLAQAFDMPGGDGSIALVVQNALDDDLEYDPRLDPGNSFGRRIFLTLGLNVR